MIRLSPRHIKISLAIALVLATLLLAFVAFNAVTKVTVKIVVSPADATLSVDGKVVPVSDEITLSKGTHTLKASRNDFVEMTKTIDTNNLDPSKKVHLLLEPANKAGEDWLNVHPDEVMKRESVTGYEFSDSQKKILEKYPIVSRLPYNSLDFLIDYTVDADKDITFIVTVKPYAKPENKTDYQQQAAQFKQEAIDYLKENKVDVSKARITYKEQSQW